METEYIHMAVRNSERVYRRPVGNEKVLIFDLDYCMYTSEEMAKYECGAVHEAFLQLSPGGENLWRTYWGLFYLFREIFYYAFRIHPSEFCRKYDVFDVTRFLKRDPKLGSMIRNLSFRKFCMTNGCEDRARGILYQLGLDDVFEVVICSDVKDLDFICKPRKSAYRFAHTYLRILDGKNVYFFDDSLHNVLGARDFGWNAIHVKGDVKQDLMELSKDIDGFWKVKYS